MFSLTSVCVCIHYTDLPSLWYKGIAFIIIDNNNNVHCTKLMGMLVYKEHTYYPVIAIKIIYRHCRDRVVLHLVLIDS